MLWPTTVLMVDPQYFDVEYAINPHMKDAKGNLNRVDKNKARSQWQGLKNKFENLNLKVEVVPAQRGLPDMVFCANQTFPFRQGGKLHLVLSQMHSEHRQAEVQHFKAWADQNHIPTHTISDLPFEGMGDALWNYETESLYAGYGFRTMPEVYSSLQKLTGQKITTFELKNERFYHLDTCLSILGADTAAFVADAFTNEGLETLRNCFTNLIEIPLDEASQQLACNMCTPNGKDVIIQSGATQTVKKLQASGFLVHEIDTSEFIKSGGSVFCMKQLLF